MTNICSKHHPSRGPIPGCVPCNTHPRDFLPGWDNKMAEADAAGRNTCTVCGFVSFLTIDCCAKCGHPVDAEIFASAQRRVADIRAKRRASARGAKSDG